MSFKKRFVDFLRPEDWLQKAVINYIEWKFPEFRFHHSPNEGKRTPFEQFFIKFMGVKSGFPDLEILYKGHSLYIELKDKDKEPTDLQMDWLIWLKGNGFWAFWSDDYNEVIKVLHNFKDYVDGKGGEGIQAPEIRERRPKKIRGNSTANKLRRGIKSNVLQINLVRDNLLRLLVTVFQTVWRPGNKGYRA